jgi:pimeloyl-ACP methyl ester carboxylesterase
VDLRKALDTANSQSSKSFALRAAMDLARLWQFQGKTDQGFANFVGPDMSAKWHQLKSEHFLASSILEARRGYMEMFVKICFSDRVKGLEVPVLAVTGEFDGEAFLKPAVEADFGALYPNLEIIVVPNAGHYPMMEAPPFFAATIEKFMTKHTG